MRKLFSVFMMWCVCVFGEYQVFTYSASLKAPSVVTKTIGLKTVENSYIVSSERITGYLVTVCCYPCGCSFGEGYPSWLYVVRSKDVTKTLWKMQMVVDGGIFGKLIVPEKFEDVRRDTQTSSEIAAIKKANLSWLYMATFADQYVEGKADPKRKEQLPYGLMGFNVLDGHLIHTGFGSASWKLNKKLEGTPEEFNPYIKNVTGTVCGVFSIPSAFSIDPSNYHLYTTTPISGTFTLRFNNTMTEAIRGYADWNDIDRIILRKMKFSQLVSGELDETLEWTYMTDLQFRATE